jgi:hypothetical protein
MAPTVGQTPLPTTQLIAEAAVRLPSIDDPLFGQAFDRFADRPRGAAGRGQPRDREFYRPAPPSPAT